MSERARLLRAAPYVLMLVLGAIEPLTHIAIQWFPPEGAVPTGLHTGDSGHHLAAMESFANGFHSPFATCKTERDTGNIAYFAVPIFLLYGIVGEIGRILGIAPFLFLGFVNGLGGVLLLWTAYRFLRRIAPREAMPAFYLYALGGGLGGAVFLAAWAGGGVMAPGFEAWFYRFAQYELIEGQHLSPTLLMPRFYYTFPMALGFAALTALVETDRCRCPGHLFFTAFLLACVACINARLGPLFWGIGIAYLLLGSTNDARYRFALAASTLAAVAAGSALFFYVLGFHPSYHENVSSIARGCILLLPLFFATAFHWPAIATAVARVTPALPRPFRAGVAGTGAYLTAHALLYLAHQIWFGNWWRGGDISAAVLASDWALLAVVPGALAGWRWTPRNYSARPIAPAARWVLVWFLALLAVSLSAWGGGWFLRFAPQRGMVLLGVPLALLAVTGMHCWTPRWRRTGYALILGGGIASQLVAALYVQGPLGRTPGEGAFAYLHYEFMTEADRDLLAELPPGNVAVPPWSPIAFGEIVARNGTCQILGGPGAMNLGDQPLAPLQRAINEFFAPGTTEAARREFVREWCVDFIYCPDTCPLDAAVLAELKSLPWLEQTAAAGRGRVFAVVSF